VVAALLLLVQDLVPGCPDWPRTASDALALTGAGKSQAYEMLGRLRNLLPALLGSPGRPAAPPPVEDRTTLIVAVAVRDYLQAHPGAACGGRERTAYTDPFRRFVVGLAGPDQPGQTLSVADLAFATGVPAGTLKDWLRQPHPAGLAAEDMVLGKGGPCEVEDDAEGPTVSIHNTHLRLTAALWPSWQGPFKAFCRMLRVEHQLPYGDTFIGNCLQALGIRERCPQRPVEAAWSSGTYRTLFPGAQWVGDGTDIAIRWGSDTFVFNVEAILDVASNALVGLTVSDTEDEEALRLAYESALETTGAAPTALTLDNRPSNHSPGAVAGTPDTTLLRSTPARGQSKAPIEGAFGLFQQALPSLSVPACTPREQARTVLHLVLQAWGRGRNGKPRKKLGDRTPAQAYIGARPTPEDVRNARLWIQELQRRQQQAQATREARRDPVRIELLTRGLSDLNIPDPDLRLTVALAGYSREAIASGLAIFYAKQDNGTVPSEADPGRYLGGIIRNRHEQLELERISVHLLEQRIRLGDLTLAPLKLAARQLRVVMSPYELPKAFVDSALDATTAVDFRFWVQAATEALSELPADQKSLFYRTLAWRIAATYSTSRDRRTELLARLADALAPPEQ
jgi:hypothetical protein